MGKKFVWDMKSTSIAAIVFYAVCGLLLILLPDAALMIGNYAIAGILAVSGVVCIIRYFVDSPVIGSFGFKLALGLVLLSLGVMIFCYPTFLGSVLPAIWGLSLLVGGFGKVQVAMDLKRMNEQRWWLLLIGALLSFVLGVLCLANPLFITQALFVFIGSFLLAEAVLDLAAMIAIRIHVRKFNKAMNEAAKNIEV